METLKSLEKRYLRALLSRDEKAAWDVVSSASEQGWNLFHLYMHVLSPALVEVGEMWHRGQVSVAEEHAATEMTTRVMDALSRQHVANRDVLRRVILACAEKEEHVLGLKMVGDFLRVEGWEVYFLGGGVPGTALADFVASYSTDLVGISVGSEEQIPSTKETMQLLRKQNPLLKIIVGGRALNENPDRIEELEADGFAQNALGALREVRRLFPLTIPDVSLNQHLRLLGERISMRRKSLKRSQKEVALRAELDRTYISGVERGKQNVTLGALFRIAEALDSSLEELLEESWESTSSIQ